MDVACPRGGEEGKGRGKGGERDGPFDQSDVFLSGIQPLQSPLWKTLVPRLEPARTPRRDTTRHDTTRPGQPRTDVTAHHHHHHHHHRRRRHHRRDTNSSSRWWDACCRGASAEAAQKSRTWLAHNDGLVSADSSSACLSAFHRCHRPTQCCLAEGCCLAARGGACGRSADHCCVASSICRKRHMKCDEVKPQCGPCAKGNRPCVYGPLPPEPDSATAGSVASIPPYYAASGAEIPLPVHDRPRPASVATEPGAQSNVLPEQSETRIGKQWSAAPVDEVTQITSPQSSSSTSTGVSATTCTMAVSSH